MRTIVCIALFVLCCISNIQQAQAESQDVDKYCWPANVQFSIKQAIKTTKDDGSVNTQQVLSKMWLDTTPGKERYHSEQNFTDTSAPNPTVEFFGTVAYTTSNTDAYVFNYKDNNCSCYHIEGMAIVSCQVGNATNNSDGTVLLDYKFHDEMEVKTTVRPTGTDDNAIFVSETTYYKGDSVVITSSSSFYDATQSVLDSDFVPPAAWNCPAQDECPILHHASMAIFHTSTRKHHHGGHHHRHHKNWAGHHKNGDKEGDHKNWEGHHRKNGEEGGERKNWEEGERKNWEGHHRKNWEGPLRKYVEGEDKDVEVHHKKSWEGKHKKWDGHHKGRSHRMGGLGPIFV